MARTRAVRVGEESLARMPLASLEDRPPRLPAPPPSTYPLGDVHRSAKVDPSEKIAAVAVHGRRLPPPLGGHQQLHTRRG